jgi:hypothetical protein
MNLKFNYRRSDMDLLASMKMINEEQLCDLLGITPTTAAAWRYRSCGPAYSKVGNKHFYLLSDIEAFIKERNTPSSSLRGIL